MSDYFSSSVTVGAHCVLAPDVCIFDLETLKLSAVAPAKYFPGASNYSLELWKPSAQAWQVYADEIGPDETILVETAYEIGLRARFAVAHEGSTLYSEEVAVTLFCCEGILPPSTPDAPVLARNCQSSTISVTSPAFSNEEDAETETIEIERSSDGGSTWEHVHTFASATSWVDESVINGEKYSYRARGCNEAGCSAWSTPALIDLISETLQLTWLSPAGGSSVRGKILLKLATDGDLTDLRLYVGGALVVPGLQHKGGGLYTLSYDTRRAVQGECSFEARALDSDGCEARAQLLLTLGNTRGNNVLYRDFRTDRTRDGYRIKRLGIQLVVGTLDDDPTARYWGQVAVTNDGSVPIVTEETDPAVAQEQFDAMQPFPMPIKKTWPKLGYNQAGARLFNMQTVAKTGPQLKVRLRQERAEWFAAYDTGSQRVAKIRQLKAGEHFVFSQGPDRVFTFKDDALTMLVDLRDAEDVQDVTDAAQVGDKIYFLTDDKLIAYDIDPLTGNRNRTLEFVIHREGRKCRFLEGIGNKLFAVFVDETREDKQTLCISLEGDQPLDRWTLDAVVTAAWSEGTLATDLYIACENDLYKSTSGTGAPGTGTPELLNSFPDRITAISTMAVGLADGSLWHYEASINQWQQAVTPGAESISAVMPWLGNLEFINLLWGNSSEPILYGQSAGGGYDVHRALETYDGQTNPPTGVTALDRYFVPRKEGEGSNKANLPFPIKGDERALIGTNGGLLLALMVSRKSVMNAFFHSSIDSISMANVPEILPLQSTSED